MSSIQDDRLNTVTEPDHTTFNFNTWLSGAVKVVKYVDVYGKPGLQAEIDELDSQLNRETATPVRQALAAQIEDLRDEMNASKIGFKFRAIPEAEASDLRAAQPGDDELSSAYRCIAAQCIQPGNLTAADIRALADALGEGYFVQTILTTANSAQQGIGVTVPFSSAASRVLSR